MFLFGAAFSIGAAFPIGAASQARAENPIEAISACLGPYGYDADAEDPHRCIGIIAQPCLDAPEGGATLSMTQCIGKETKAWDAILNRDYRALLERLDEGQTQSLNDAQRAWVTLREEDCAFAHEFVRGSLSSVLAAECFQNRTADRVLALRGYINFLEW